MRTVGSLKIRIHSLVRAVTTDWWPQCSVHLQNLLSFDELALSFSTTQQKDVIPI